MDNVKSKPLGCLRSAVAVSEMGFKACSDNSAEEECSRDELLGVAGDVTAVANGNAAEALMRKFAKSKPGYDPEHSTSVCDCQGFGRVRGNLHSRVSSMLGDDRSLVSSLNYGWSMQDT